MFYEINRQNNNVIALLRLAVVILFGFITAYLILLGSKIAFGIIILIFMVLIYMSIVLKKGDERANSYLLHFIIFTIPFPYLVQFMGRDALTITTLFIFFLFIVIALNHLYQKRRLILEPKLLFILPILIFFSLTTSLIFNPYYIGQSIRYYIANISGIILYFITLAVVKKQSDVILIIKIILLTLIIHSAISFLQLKYPDIVKSFFIPFGTRTSTHYAPIAGGIMRTTSIIHDYELLAEMFLIGSILSMALIYHTRKFLYIIPLFCCLSGIIFTNTRSDLILFSFTLLFTCIILNLFKKDYKGTSIKIILLVISGCMILTVIIPNQINEFIQRFKIFFHSSQIISLEAINRKKTWEMAFFFLKKPTIFGAGLYNIQSLYSWAGSFHSLYFTILYKIGIFGLIIHAIFWLKMLNRGWHDLVTRNKCKNWYILFFLFCAVIFMLIDGIKVEYLRLGHAIQFAWLIYALLVVSLRQSEENNEDIMVSPTPIRY